MMRVHLQADEAMSQNDFEACLEKLTQALAAAPVENKRTLWSQLLVARAHCLLKLKRPLAAISDCMVVLAYNSTSAAALMCRGQAYRHVGRWEEAKSDIDQAQVVDFNPKMVSFQKQVNFRVTLLLQAQAKAELIRLERESILDAARERTAALRRQLQAMEPEDGYRGLASQPSLLYDIRGDPVHLHWLGDVSSQIAAGIARFARGCAHDSFQGYLTRLDVRGHVVSMDGVLAIAKALKTIKTLVTLRISKGGLDFDVSSDEFSVWRLYSEQVCCNMTRDYYLENFDENRTSYLNQISDTNLVALG